MNGRIYNVGLPQMHKHVGTEPPPRGRCGRGLFHRRSSRIISERGGRRPTPLAAGNPGGPPPRAGLSFSRHRVLRRGVRPRVARLYPPGGGPAEAPLCRRFLNKPPPPRIGPLFWARTALVALADARTPPAT